MDFQTAASIFPVVVKVPAENRRISGRDRVAFLRQFARRAVLLSAEKSGLMLPALEQDANGAPIPVGGTFWSLSHKPGCVAGVVACHSIGIDVEEIRPISPGLLEKVLDFRERQFADGPSPEFFFRSWTAKEAVLKAVGAGLGGLAKCRIKALSGPSAMTVSFDGRDFDVHQAGFGAYRISVATRAKTVFWALPEPDGI